jgi:hypothetical protein
MAAEPQTVEIKPDSYSYVFVSYREAVARVNPEDRLTRATGSDLRMQILSDAVNVPISLTRVGDAPALGSTILAVVGEGVFPDVREATHEMVHVERQIEPGQSRHDEYRFYVDKYVETYPRMRELMHETVRHVASGGRPEAATKAKAVIGATEHGHGQPEDVKRGGWAAWATTYGDGSRRRSTSRAAATALPSSRSTPPGPP